MLKTMIWDHATAMWRWRWQALATAWFVCVAGWVVLAMLPNTYETRARLYVDSENILKPLFKGLTVESSLPEVPTPAHELEIIRRLVLSRPNLEKIAETAGMDPGSDREKREKFFASLRDRINIASSAPNIFELSFASTDAAESGRVVEVVLDVFADTVFGHSRADMGMAQRLVDQQLGDYQRQLAEVARKIADFRAQHAGELISPTEYNTRLETARSDLARSRSELVETQRRRDELARLAASVSPYLPTPSAASGVESLPERPLTVAELEDRLRALRRELTDKHPDVIETRRQLDLARKAEEERPRSRQPASAPRTANPFYEQVTMQLSQTEAMIAGLKNRIDAQMAAVRDWEKIAQTGPALTAELERLERDHEVIRRQYVEMLSRRESARIAQDLAQQERRMQFRIIDPPVTPLKPTFPRRGLLTAAIFVGGVGSAVALAFLLVCLDTTMRHINQLRAAVPLPVLGGISLVHTPAARRRQAFSSVAFGLLVGVLFAALLAQLFLVRIVLNAGQLNLV